MRIIAVVLGIGVLTMSPALAHGHSAPRDPGFPRVEAAPAEPSSQKPFHDWLQPQTHEQKNPYENLSCPELYTLATQGNQNTDMAQAFEDKDCHAL